MSRRRFKGAVSLHRGGAIAVGSAEGICDPRRSFSHVERVTRGQRTVPLKSRIPRRARGLPSLLTAALVAISRPMALRRSEAYARHQVASDVWILPRAI